MWRIRQFFACLKDEKGIGVVEVILILVGGVDRTCNYF